MSKRSERIWRSIAVAATFVYLLAMFAPWHAGCYQSKSWPEALAATFTQACGSCGKRARDHVGRSLLSDCRFRPARPAAIGTSLLVLLSVLVLDAVVVRRLLHSRRKNTTRDATRS